MKDVEAGDGKYV